MRPANLVAVLLFKGDLGKAKLATFFGAVNTAEVVAVHKRMKQAEGERTRKRRNK